MCICTCVYILSIYIIHNIYIHMYVCIYVYIYNIYIYNINVFVKQNDWFYCWVGNWMKRCTNVSYDRYQTIYYIYMYMYPAALYACYHINAIIPDNLVRVTATQANISCGAKSQENLFPCPDTFNTLMHYYYITLYSLVYFLAILIQISFVANTPSAKLDLQKS